MLKMKLNEIRGQIQIHPENWFNLSTTNCYAYALGLDINESEICDYAYQPGTISKTFNLNRFKECINYNTLIKCLERDLTTLNISYREIEPCGQIESNEWKIALFIEPYDGEESNKLLIDFHFLRETPNGVWFHKNGFKGIPNKKDYLGKIITNPTTCCLEPYEYKKCYALKMNER